MKLDYEVNKQIIESLYSNLGLHNEFNEDIEYLERAFKEINDIWIENFKKIDEVKYLLIAEAPLWGSDHKYIYNPHTNNSQFFFRSDLETILNIKISDQREFIEICNQIGLLVVDIFPFPLNTRNTRINYSKNTVESKNTIESKKLTQKEYRDLVRHTMQTFFEKKIRWIGEKKSPDIKVFFRYGRVKNTFQDLISDILIQNGLIKRPEDISEISQRGGGIDRVKLKKIISDNYNPNLKQILEKYRG